MEWWGQAFRGLYELVTPYSYFAQLRAVNHGALTDTLTTTAGTYPGGNAFFGGVLLPDGRVFCVPYNSATARIYDPTTDTITTPAGTYPGGGAFTGGVLLPDGRVFCVPRVSTTARIYGNPLPSPLPLDRVINAYDNKL